ncbi:DAK2 domain-containing protein [Clostridium sp. 'White wine YQ']|uniref:DAK2 domain-containing protein n=1 Tax=Clostridium sp. 'White wine YQ' TaxID=3027474 RepID=UPI0023660F11|nr:DAK2 domain-containing protein [Clostridium sp. 'White wine YQ']MDD7793751.1 DAK2 domain-containing protein [Clostridium sp. 'White wine YQ']
MKYTKINGHEFYRMVIHASNKLEEQSDYVNSLNVFPVPDGDTGTNMSMTFKAAAKEIENINSDNIGEVSKKLAKGALMGARGNSGVILSQILRGISKGLEGKKEVSSKELSLAFQEGSKAAYKAVMKPTEGTILTIIRAAAESAVASSQSDITSLMKEICKDSEIMLNKTPDMLPALKQAKVVDSGGMGLLIILKGMHEALAEDIKPTIGAVSKAPAANVKAQELVSQDIKFGYCTEFIVLGDASKANSLKEKISSLGDSMIVVGYEDVIKVHIHSNDPGAVLSHAVQFGELSKIKIDNMREEHRSLLTESSDGEEEVASVSENKEYGFISVAMGSGISDIFKDLGVDYIIEGGQTMNPSTQDMVEAINKINAEHIFILPNNKNIQMAATQAAEISDKDVRVIASKTIPQGITAITMFNPEAKVEENEAAMIEALGMVKSASITYAVRDTEMDGIEIREGNILGLLEGKINQVGEDIFKVTEDVLSSMVDEDSELITLFFGEEITKEKAEEFVSVLEEKYEDLDIQLYNGNQPLYYFIMSVE